MDCVFCKIVAGEIPSRKVSEEDRTLAFYDLDPYRRGRRPDGGASSHPSAGKAEAGVASRLMTV